MQIERSSQFQVPHNDDVPHKAHQAVNERLVTAERTRLKKDAKSAAKIMSIANSHKNQIQRLLGATKYKQLRKFVDKEKQKQAKSLLSLSEKGTPITPDVSKKLHLDKQRSLTAFLRRLGVDLARFQAINKRTLALIHRTEPSVPKRANKPVALIQTPNVPRDIRTMRTNPWTIKTPPYPGWAWDYSGYLSGFRFDPTLYIDPAAGLVGNSNYLWDSSASDFDYGYVGYNSAIGFWFKTTKAGLIEIWIKAQSAYNQHYCSLYDEWGWSGSSVYQRNYLTLKATSPAADVLRKTQMSWWYESGHTSGHWNNSYLATAGTYWAHMFTDVPFPKDTWVYLLAGTHNWNSCYANDVSVYSKIKFKWFIEAVYARST